MTPLELANAHLEKAEEFLDAAEMSLEMDLFNAATPTAVTSGINSKDAVCLRLTGASGKTQNHAAAIRELKDAGPTAAKLAPTFGRLLKPKTKAQYQAVSIARAEARTAVEHAKTLLDAARAIVAS